MNIGGVVNLYTNLKVRNKSRTERGHKSDNQRCFVDASRMRRLYRGQILSHLTIAHVRQNSH